MSYLNRSRVLSLYRQIWRLARSWESASGMSQETQEERSYICNEAQQLFKRNKQETSLEKIEEYIKEAEARIELAKHYGTPYPRLMNIPQNVLAPHGSSSLRKAQRRALKQATPSYLKSYEETDDKR